MLAIVRFERRERSSSTELVEARRRLYPNLTDEEIEEFLRAHGARSPHQIDSDRGFSAGLRVGELPAKSIQLQRARNGRARPATIDMRRFITEPGELRIRSQPPDDLSLCRPIGVCRPARISSIMARSSAVALARWSATKSSAVRRLRCIRCLALPLASVLANAAATRMARPARRHFIDFGPGC
jgi:hypothetical protein